MSPPATHLKEEDLHQALQDIGLVPVGRRERHTYSTDYVEAVTDAQKLLIDDGYRVEPGVHFMPGFSYVMTFSSRHEDAASEVNLMLIGDGHRLYPRALVYYDSRGKLRQVVDPEHGRLAPDSDVLAGKAQALQAWHDMHNPNVPAFWIPVFKGTPLATFS